MKAWNTTGMWHGEYFYNPSEFFPEDFSGVPFELDLKQSWFGRFRGCVQDKSEKGMAEPGVVHGKIDGYKISFIKRMPVLCVISATGVKTLSDYWLDNYNIQLDYPLEHPPIYYQGEFCPSQNQVSGVWHIKEITISARSEGKLIKSSAPMISGEWYMKRKDEQI